MKVIMKITQTVIFCCAVASSLAAEKGDICRQDDGTTGKCELLYDCISGLSDLEDGIRPQICGFDDKMPIVCCIERLARINKSAAKCYDYARMSLQSRFGNSHLKKNETLTAWGISLQASHAIGGTFSEKQEFPHMAALGYGDKNNPKWMCGGSLISDQYVLTAAHCLKSREFGDVKWVRLGDLNLYTLVDDTIPQDFHIEKIIKHPGYMPPSRYHDIALLKLNRKVKYTNYVYPACLHPEDNIDSKTLTATGWGLTKEFGNPSDHLIKVDLDIYSDEECQRMYRPERTIKKGVLSDSQFCAGGRTTEKGTCSGDSGGPIQIKTDNVRNLYSVVGITSFGRGCAVINTAGVYTRVSRYIPWIESVVWPDEYSN